MFLDFVQSFLPGFRQEKRGRDKINDRAAGKHAEHRQVNLNAG
jgi:hypothetical protein